MKDLVLFDDKDYQKVLTPLFSKYHNPANNIFPFLVKFDSKLKITRTIEIHGRQSFNQLAKIVIKSMNWFNDHMHGFSLTTPVNGAMFDPNHYSWFAPHWEDDPHPYIHTDKVKIYHFNFEKHSKLDMTFDYGDNHNFLVELIGKRVLTPKEKQSDFPKIVKSYGRPIAQYPDRDDETGEIINIYKNYFDE